MGNLFLESLPNSWSQIPYLQEIDASLCPQLKYLPFTICQKPSALKSLHIQGTIVSKTLDWSSGELSSKFNSSDNKVDFQLLKACTNALRKSVHVVDLSRNNLSQEFVSAILEYFENWNQIKVLDLSHNRVTSFGESIFEKTENILGRFDDNMTGSLSLRHNNITNISLAAISVQTILRVLDSVHDLDNGTASIDMSTNRVERLKLESVIGGNAFTVPLRLCETPFANYITFLSISSSSAASIEAATFDCLHNLKTLQLDGNQLKSLHVDTFRSLKQLRELSLSRNEISYLGGSMFQTVSDLKELDLENNRFDSLESIDCLPLTSLEELDLRGNNISEINEGSSRLNMTNLIHLDLSHNELQSIQSSFQQLTNLESLDLSSNALQRLDSAAFDS